MELHRYNGPLTAEQLIGAHKKIVNNAKSLYQESQLLFQNAMFARSYYLLCIANEELGKSIMVISALVDLIAGGIDWNTFWKKFRNHKSKTGTIEFMENAFVSSDENLTPFQDLKKQIPLLEEIKMSSLYADMFQDCFFNPNEVITPQIVKEFTKLTSHRIEFIDAIYPRDEVLHTITKEDILSYRTKLSEMGIHIYDKH